MMMTQILGAAGMNLGLCYEKDDELYELSKRQNQRNIVITIYSDKWMYRG